MGAADIQSNVSGICLEELILSHSEADAKANKNPSRTYLIQWKKFTLFTPNLPARRLKRKEGYLCSTPAPAHSRLNLSAYYDRKFKYVL